jgi:nicotinate phosphoribosyltransferase
MTRERLDPGVFDLPVERIRRGWFTDAYFNLAKAVIDSDPDADPVVTMQVFQKQDALLAGIDEAIAVLKLCAGGPDPAGEDGWASGWERLEVLALHEGDRIEPWETVMQISGPYSCFAHLETVYLGCLARGSRIATNVARVVEAADGKPVLFFPARHDRYPNQAADGWAARLAGAEAVSTDAQASWWEGKGIGTVPHALIAAYDGDTVAAARAFADRYGTETNVVVLVDFDNDSTRTAVAVADELGERLWGVRLDTAGSLVDRALWDEMGDFDPTGVNVALAERVRDALDRAGHEGVRIVVSGGFDAEKVAHFERVGAPVDVYGVGSALLRGAIDFTADVVLLEGEPKAKVGRRRRPNERLDPVG